MNRVVLGCVLLLLSAPAAVSAQRPGRHKGAVLYSAGSCRSAAVVFLPAPQPVSVEVPAPRNSRSLCPSCRGEMRFHFFISVNEQGTVCVVASDGVIRKRQQALAKAVARNLAAYTFPPARQNGRAVSSTFLLDAIVDLP